MWVGTPCTTEGGCGGVNCWAPTNTTGLDEGSLRLAPLLGSTICSFASNGVTVDTSTIAWPLAVVWSMGTDSGTLRLSGTATPLTR